MLRRLADLNRRPRMSPGVSTIKNGVHLSGYIPVRRSGKVMP